jgi:hypothetical protein
VRPSSTGLIISLLHKIPHQPYVKSVMYVAEGGFQVENPESQIKLRNNWLLVWKISPIHMFGVFYE